MKLVSSLTGGFEMSGIRLNPSGIEFIREHLRKQCEDPDAAKEILKAVEVLGIPSHEFLSFISGGDFLPERLEELDFSRESSE